MVERARNVRVRMLRRRREWTKDLPNSYQPQVTQDTTSKRTSWSALWTNISTARAAPFAMALTSSGSNLAASSSLTTARAVLRPSFGPGTAGGREVNEAERDDEMEKDELTASVSRFVERVR